MSKERLEEAIEILTLYKGGAWVLPETLNESIELVIEQAERADYYEYQNERKAKALGEIISLLTEDYFENWEQAIEVASSYKRDSVRAEKLESDLRFRTKKDEELFNGDMFLEYEP